MKNLLLSAVIILASAFILFSNPSLAQTTFQSVIVSQFDGLNNGNYYELENGQIWRQTEPWIWYWYWVMPQVVIYPENGIWKMKVENIEHSVSVERIK